MSTLQDVREFITSSANCLYTPSIGKIIPWEWRSERQHEFGRSLTYEETELARGNQVPYREDYDLRSEGFSEWHNLILGSTTATKADYHLESPNAGLPEMKVVKKKFQALRRTDACVAAILPDNELQLVNKTGQLPKQSFKEFVCTNGLMDINVGNRSLTLHDAEVPPGAVTLVMTMGSDKTLGLVHTSINESYFVTKAVFTTIKDFLENCLLRKPLSTLWSETRPRNLILSVSVWDGFIKFHNADETFNQIMAETGVDTFANHLRLRELLKSTAIERAVELQIDNFLKQFEETDIVAAPEQKKTLSRLISRDRKTTGPQTSETLPTNSLYDVNILQLALKDFALLSGIEDLKLPEEQPETRRASGKTTSYLTLPRDEAIALIASHAPERPFWYGHFWKEQDVHFNPKHEAIGRAAACIKRINSLPYDEVINSTIAFQPKAEPLLRRWREIWDRSFPGWQSLPEWHFDKSEKPTTEQFVHDVERAFKWASQKAVYKSEALSNFDEWIENVSDDKRDFRLHVIDDADAVCAMVHLAPGTGFLSVVGVSIQYTGIDAEGYPMFREAEHSSKRVRSRLHSCPDYWNWPFYKKYLGRRAVVTSDGKHTAAVLADMALQGHTHAFLKGIAQKSGTWTVNLGGVTNLETAQQRLAGTLERDYVHAPMYVQEQVPFTHEQRYYIQGGRMFASACSDRNFSCMNSNGKRLDSRVAVLKRPSIDAGSYDRGQTENLEDRKTSAMFARQVRKIVAELREYGLQDYSIDMGLTERGMISVEVNTLHMAGPYNMRRELYTKQFERTRKKANDLLANKACDIIRSTQLPEYVLQKAVAITMASDNLVQLALTFADTPSTPSADRVSEEMKIAMLILLLAIISIRNPENQTMTEAA